MKAEHIVEIFKEFVKEKEERAFVINGEWGSGKTYFWKNILTKIAKEEKKIPIHISLARVASITDLERLIAKKILLPTFENISEKKKSKFVGVMKVMKDVAKQVADKKLGFDLVEASLNYGIELHNYTEDVICFDDLERCNIEIKELLGFIGDFIESNSAKVLILVNEDSIGFGTAKEEQLQIKKLYNDCKEKISSISVKFSNDINEIFKVISDNANSNFYKDHNEYILKLFKTLGYINLRTMMSCLRLLDKLIPHIDDKYASQYKDIITYICIILKSYKDGYIETGKSETLKNLTHKIIQHQIMESSKLKDGSSKNTKGDIKKAYSEIIYEKYIRDSSLNLVDYESLGAFILEGYLDKDLLKEELSKYSNDGLPEYIIAFNKIVKPNKSFSLLSDEQFQENIKLVKKFIGENKYSSYDLFSLGSWFLSYARCGLLEETEEEISELFCGYMKEAKSNSPYAKGGIGDFFFYRESKSSEHQEKLDKCLVEVYNSLKKYYEESFAVKFLSKATDTSTTIEELENGILCEEQIPFMQYLSIDGFAEAILSWDNEKIKCISHSFRERYRYLPEDSSLIEEKAFVEKLIITLEEKLKEEVFQKTTIRKLNIMHLVNSLKMHKTNIT